MRKSPFPPTRPEADLHFTQSVMLADGGGPACAKYRPLGLRLLAEHPGKTPAEFLDILKQTHEGFWDIGTQSLGLRGWSRDVARRHPMNSGEW